jgi:hypothetical protein
MRRDAESVEPDTIRKDLTEEQSADMEMAALRRWSGAKPRWQNSRRLWRQALFRVTAVDRALEGCEVGAARITIWW